LAKMRSSTVASFAAISADLRRRRNLQAHRQSLVGARRDSCRVYLYSNNVLPHEQASTGSRRTEPSSLDGKIVGGRRLTLVGVR